MEKSRKIFTANPADPGQSLQQAIDSAAADGLALSLPKGVHRCGPLRLPSGTDLWLDEGAILRFDPDYALYASNTVDVIAEDSDRALILAQEARSIRIRGAGMIEAPGEAFIEGLLEDMGTHIPSRHRPRTLVIDRCSDVQIEGIKIGLSAMWTVHLIRSEDVRLERVSIINDRKMPNTDGVVVDGCERVTIENCVIDTADDGVVLKTSRGADGASIGACRSIRVAKCSIISESCALKLGTESFGEMSDILFEDCDIAHSNRALGLFSRDGGRLANVTFRRLTLDCRETPEGFWGSGEAITATVLDRRSTQPAGAIENILFEDIRGRMEGAINLYSDKPGLIRNVTLRRVSIHQAPGRFNACRYDVRPTKFDLAPSPDAAGRANAWVRGEDGKVIGLVDYPGGMPGVFASNVENLVLEGVEVTRPTPLPAGFHPDTIVVMQDQPSVWS
ncbi:MAG: glycosyl hydrolase family 28 protein [Rhizobium sp.]|nr:glycosyl hydrolase family 28 protein [Rhizobium sp.]